MQDRDSLIRENEELKARLKNCQAWMLRQVAEARLQIERAKVSVSGRHYFVSNFESNVLENIDSIILTYFWDELKNAPKFTLERLHDAEIYWNTLQKFPHIDGLSVVLSYQKILDAYFEKITHIFHGMKSTEFHTYETSWIEHDISQVIHKWYTLSIGRWYSILEMIQEHQNLSPWVRFFIEHIESHFPHLIERLTSESVMVPLRELVQGEYFSHKRHASKVSFVDTKTVREICVGGLIPGKDSLFLNLFS